MYSRTQTLNNTILSRAQLQKENKLSSLDKSFYKEALKGRLGWEKFIGSAFFKKGTLSSKEVEQDKGRISFVVHLLTQVSASATGSFEVRIIL